MANPTTTTAFMLLVLPVPLVEVGPEWAQELVDALTNRLDPHDHSPGKGVKITPAGIDVVADLDFTGSDAIAHNAKNVRAVLFGALGGTPNGVNDLRAIYAKNDGELYYLDGSLREVRITLNGSLDGSGFGSITGLAAPASASYAAGVFAWAKAVGISAAMDMGTIRVREMVAGGHRVSLAAKTGLAADIDMILWDSLPAAGKTYPVSLNDLGQLASSAAPVLNARPTFEGINPGNTADGTAGNIRYSGTDLEGRVAGAWRSLTGKAIGQIVSFSRTEDGAVHAVNSNVPFDDTIPNWNGGEGTPVIGHTHVLNAQSKAGNILRVRMLLNVSMDGVHANVHILGGFYCETGAGTNLVGEAVVNPGQQLMCQIEAEADYVLVAGDIVAGSVNFDACIGTAGAQAITVNGQAGARRLGGKMLSYMESMEIAQ
jgi:hypothetical protein